jgi:diaminohydroxyphosphoribosylaminopyrimidine deaminase/5-amino-6-(5-phosphoribosylamino)uracil reductase
LDSRLQVKIPAAIFQGLPKTVVFTSPKALLGREKALWRKGIQVFRVPLKGKMLSLEAVLRVLHSLSVRSLLVEGGAEVHASFLREKLADELALFVAPKIFGGPAKGWVGGAGVPHPDKAWRVHHTNIEKLGEDYLLTARLRE